MALLSHPSSIPVQQHGLRALEWVAATGGAAARALVDEGVCEVASEVLRRHDDTEVLRTLCATLAKVVRFYRSMCLLHHRQLPTRVSRRCVARAVCRPSTASWRRSRRTRRSWPPAASSSPRWRRTVAVEARCLAETFCAELVALDFASLAVALLNVVSQAETVQLLTGTLWKMALLPAARPQLAEGLDALLHSLQTFPLHAGIQRNALGVLFNLSLSGRRDGEVSRDGSLPERLLSRLALPAILDSLDALRSDGAVALQGISLLQSLMKGRGGTRLTRRSALSRVLTGARESGDGGGGDALPRGRGAGAGHVASLPGHGDDDA